MNPLFSYDYLFPIICILFILVSQLNKVYKEGLSKSLRYHITLIDIFAITLFCFCTLNRYFLSAAPFILDDYFRIILIAAFYVILRLFVTGNNRLQFNYIILIAFFGSIEAFIAVTQIVTGKIATGSFGNRAVLANFLAAAFPFVCWIFILGIRKKIKPAFGHIAVIAVCVIIVVVFLYSFSRTACLSILGTGIIITILEIKILSKMLFRVRKFSLVLMAALCSGILFTILLLLKKDSTSGRWFVINRELEMLKDNLLSGIGFGNFERLYNQHQAFYFSVHENPEEEFLASYINVNYSEFLDFILQGGIIGIVFLTLFLFKIFPLLKKCKNEHYVYIYSLVSISILGLFSYPSETLPIVCIFIFSLSIIGSSEQERLKAFSLPAYFVLVPTYVISLLISAALLSQYNNALRWHVINSKSKKSQTIDPKIDNIYANLATKLANDPIILIEYGKYLINTQQYDRVISTMKRASLYSSKYTIYMLQGESYEKIGNITKAIESYRYASLLVPNLFYPKYRLMKIYSDNGKNEESLQIAQKIIKQPIKINSQTVRDIKNSAIAQERILLNNTIK